MPVDREPRAAQEADGKNPRAGTASRSAVTASRPERQAWGERDGSGYRHRHGEVKGIGIFADETTRFASCIWSQTCGTRMILIAATLLSPPARSTDSCNRVRKPDAPVAAVDPIAPLAPVSPGARLRVGNLPRDLQTALFCRGKPGMSTLELPSPAVFPPSCMLSDGCAKIPDIKLVRPPSATRSRRNSG